MADVQVTLVLRKRWFFWPALVTLVVLGKVGIIKDPEWAGRWLAENAMRIEVR